MNHQLPTPQLRRMTDGDSFLRVREVLRRVGVSRSTWLDWVRDGHAPQPVRLGPKKHLVAWRASDILSWMDKQPSRAATEVDAVRERYPFSRSAQI